MHKLMWGHGHVVGLLYWNGQLGWTPALGLYLWGIHSLREEDVHVTSNVELRNNVRLLLNVDLRNYIIT